MNHTSLLWNRKFWPLCFTQFFGALNDNFFKNALIIMITFQSMSFAGLSSEKLIALCGGIFIIPFFFFSAFAGRIADKYEKSQLMRYIKVLEICIITLAGVGFLINNLFILFIALFLMGVQSTLFSPLKYSYMPLQVDNNTLVEANALLQSSTFLSILLGTILGGIIIAIPEKGAFYVSLGGIILAYIGFLFSLFILKVKPLNKNTDQKNLSSTKSLIFYILKIRNIRWTILTLSWFWFYGAAIITILPGYGKNILGGDESVVTFLLTLFSIGIGTGCIVCKKLCSKKLKPILAPIGMLGLSVFLLDLAFASYFINPENQNQVMSFTEFIKQPRYFRFLFDFIIIAFSGGLFFVPLITFLQRIAPKEHLSKVIAGGNIIDAFFIVLSAVTLILLFSLNLNEMDIFFILSGLSLIISFFIYKFSKVQEQIIKDQDTTTTNCKITI